MPRCDDHLPPKATARSSRRQTFHSDWPAGFILDRSFRVMVPTGTEHPTVVVNSVDPVDWACIVDAKPNVLLCGDASFVDALMDALLPHCLLPIQTLPQDLGRLSSFSPTGTVLLPDVANYNKQEQEALLDWLENEGSTVQLISTTNGPVLDLVERGEFLAELFYCLNVVYLDVGCPLDHARSH
jgi:hypothetical protein